VRMRPAEASRLATSAAKLASAGFSAAVILGTRDSGVLTRLSEPAARRCRRRTAGQLSAFHRQAQPRGKIAGTGHGSGGYRTEADGGEVAGERGSLSHAV
jgi:hypothetical protein